MRSFRQMLNLKNDLERLALTPFYARSSLFPYEPLSWHSNRLDQLERYAIENQAGKDDFKLSIDVKQFKPEELKVKVVDDCVVVEGRQENLSDDNQLSSHHFVRRYALPRDCDVGKVVSTLTPDGVLTVSVSKPQAIEHHVDIKQVVGSAQEALKEKSESNTSAANIESGTTKEQ